MAKPAAGVIASSHRAAPCDSSVLSIHGATMTMIAIVTAAALRLATVPMASARIAATASSAAVPATSRTSVSVLAGSMKLPPWRSDRPARPPRRPAR